MGFAKIDGLRIHYRGDPHAQRGLRVLYVHGTGCNGRVWDRHREVIGRHHTAVAIDLPGHGESAGSGFRGVADYAHYTTHIEHANFGVRVSNAIAHGLVYPIGITLPITGAAMILIRGMNLAERPFWWPIRILRVKCHYLIEQLSSHTDVFC